MSTEPVSSWMTAGRAIKRGVIDRYLELCYHVTAFHRRGQGLGASRVFFEQADLYEEGRYSAPCQ
jgi:hypothetical protein